MNLLANLIKREWIGICFSVSSFLLETEVGNLSIVSIFKEFFTKRLGAAKLSFC